MVARAHMTTKIAVNQLKWSELKIAKVVITPPIAGASIAIILLRGLPCVNFRQHAQTFRADNIIKGLIVSSVNSSCRLRGRRHCEIHQILRKDGVAIWVRPPHARVWLLFPITSYGKGSPCYSKNMACTPARHDPRHCSDSLYLLTVLIKPATPWDAGSVITECCLDSYDFCFADAATLSWSSAQPKRQWQQ